MELKKKTIVWMSEWNGYIKATIYFPDRYLEELLALNISEPMKDQIGKEGRQVCALYI